MRILKVNERNLVPSIDAEKLTMSFGSDDVDEVANRTGSLVWQGDMAITGERNRPVSTAIPLKDVLKDKGPGVYLAVVERTDVKEGEDTGSATNWVLVSNLGLTAYTGADGMAVAVRSLADAKPVAGVTLRLYAHNNAELGSATTDAQGIARFAGGPAARQGRRRAVRGDGLWRGRRLQLPRGRPRRVRPQRPRGQRPRRAGPGRRLSLHRPRHLPAGRERPPDGAGARRQGRRAGRTCR